MGKGALLQNASMMWSRKCVQELEWSVVPEGPNDSSLAVYCQEWVQERNRPVGYGVTGSEGTLYHLERITREQTNSDRTLRDGSLVKPIPGNKCQATFI